MGHFSTFECFRPHFNALARVGYFKIVMRDIPRHKYMLHSAYRAVAFCLVLLYNLQHVVKVYKSRHSTDMIINVLFVLLTTLNTLSKQLAFNLRSRRIDRLIRVIDGPLFACSKPNHDQSMSQNATEMSSLLTLYHGAIFTCGTLWAVFPLVNRALGVDVAFTAYFPFDTSMPPRFELAIAYLTVLITFQAYGHVTMDCTIVSFYAQGKTQLQIFRYNLEHLVDAHDESVKIDGNLNCNNNDLVGYKDMGYEARERLKKRFVRCLLHFRQIVWFINEVELIFFEAMVLQFLVSAWVICMTLYKIVSLSILSAEFVSMAVYLGCILAQLLSYCYYGTQLKVESEMVNQSIYCCDWLQLSPGFRRLLLVLMERCRRAIVPRIAFVIPLSLETYIAVLRLSYTLFTVLDRK
uniref:Odorant receptor n=1 Tax=Plutella xylostella TaxID=51655 RepID=A0A8G1GMH6_PLUXY|nr:odorant receptor 23 [Plutella xylostella]